MPFDKDAISHAVTVLNTWACDVSLDARAKLSLSHAVKMGMDARMALLSCQLGSMQQVKELVRYTDEELKRCQERMNSMRHLCDSIPTLKDELKRQDERMRNLMSAKSELVESMESLKTVQGMGQTVEARKNVERFLGTDE